MIRCYYTGGAIVHLIHKATIPVLPHYLKMVNFEDLYWVHQ